MKKNKKILIGFVCLLVALLSVTVYTSFSASLEEDEIIIRSITPIYDENNEIDVNQNSVIFNDKNQAVQYKVVLENTEDVDLYVKDISLSTPTEKFLNFEVKDIEVNEKVSANSTKELTIHLETMDVEGWGRNFNDKLTTIVRLDKSANSNVVPPSEEEKEDDDDEVTEAPKEEEDDDDDEVTEAPKEEDDDDDEVTEAPKEDEKVDNPYTSTFGFLTVIVGIGCVSLIVIAVYNKKKPVKYMIFILALGTTLSLTKAEDLIEVKINVLASFESQNIMKEAPRPQYRNCNDSVCTSFWHYDRSIRNIYIRNEISEIAEFEYKFDVTEEDNGRVTAYLVTNQDDPAYYDLHLQADGIIYPNENASHYFADMMELDKIENLEGLDTSEVTDMSHMFDGAGFNREDFTLDLSSLDTSNVTNMDYIFEYTGFKSKKLILDLSSFDTSKVTNMSYMFHSTGYNSDNFVIDLSGFDTSNVTNMSYMFYYTGSNSENFILDLSSFDTSNVTNMSHMFHYTGSYSKNLELDLSSFDTSNVVDMSSMFEVTGKFTTNFNLNISNFDTSKVTDMSNMFDGTGSMSETFSLDLSNFDTSNVTDMSHMFAGMGYNSKNITLDLSNFDTRNVTDMSGMFSMLGYDCPNITIDLSSFNTSKVTDMNSMFYVTGYNSENFILDVSNFNTSKVTDMSRMFERAGYNNENFNFDVSNFDTSNVTNMNSMFYGTGYNSTKLNTSITIKNPNITSYSNMFYNVATKEGSQITVNYTSETEETVDKMIATKSYDSNVVKGKSVE